MGFARNLSVIAFNQLTEQEISDTIKTKGGYSTDENKNEIYGLH